jgi:hypothetical protein
MTTEQLLEKLRKSGLEEVDARTSRSIVFKINDDKFIEVQEQSRSLYAVVFWQSIDRDPGTSRIPGPDLPWKLFVARASRIVTHECSKALGTSFWGHLKIWNVCRSNKFEEHFTRFLNE